MSLGSTQMIELLNVVDAVSERLQVFFISGVPFVFVVEMPASKVVAFQKALNNAKIFRYVLHTKLNGDSLYQFLYVETPEFLKEGLLLQKEEWLNKGLVLHDETE